MRFLHITNIISHHQLPLARALASVLGERNYRFAATQPPSSERARLGWPTSAPESWVLRPGEEPQHRGLFAEWCADADVVLCGERLLDVFAARLGRDRLTFYMSERWWKPLLGMARLLHSRYARMAARFRHLARSEWFHYLAMGGYAARDMRRLARFDGRLWQWGYFTDLPRPLPSVGERSGPLRVLWAGRMLSLKRVDTLVRAFATLRSQNDAATLTLIGEGPCRASIVRLVERLDLDGAVDLLASMPVEEVLQQMQQAHVYVLPSNAYEGWGAVVNESMSQGCAVIASHAAGSAKAIIQHGQNGMLFRPGDWRSLGRLLCELDEDESMRLRLAQAGQRAIAETWSPAIAAERLVAASSALLSGEPVPRYSGGPMAQER